MPTGINGLKRTANIERTGRHKWVKANGVRYILSHRITCIFRAIGINVGLNVNVANKPKHVTGPTPYLVQFLVHRELG